MDFGEILTRAWNIIWRHKILWLFGLFAALASGGNGSGGSGVNYQFGDGDFRFENMPQEMQRFWENLPPWLPGLLILIGLILLVLTIVLGTFGRIGLARGAWLADEGRDRLTFGELWGTGSRYFWRALLLIVLMIVITITVFLIVLIPTIGISILTLGIGLLCLLPFLCVLAIAASFLTVIFDLALIAIVNEDLGVTDGLRRAWNVIQPRLGQVILMAIVLWLISLVFGFVVGLPVLLIVTPIVASALIGGELAIRGGVIVALVLFLLYLPILLVLGGVMQSYLSSAWTLVYRRLTGRGPGQSVVGL